MGNDSESRPIRGGQGSLSSYQGCDSASSDPTSTEPTSSEPIKTEQSILIKMLLIRVLRHQLYSFFMKEMHNRSPDKFNALGESSRAAYRRELLKTLKFVDNKFLELDEFKDTVSGAQGKMECFNALFDETIYNITIAPYKYDFNDSRFYERFLKNFGGVLTDESKRKALRSSCNFDPNIMISPFAELYKTVMGEFPGENKPLESGQSSDVKTIKENNHSINVLINALGSVQENFEYTSVRGKKRAWLSTEAKIEKTDEAFRTFKFENSALLLKEGEDTNSTLLDPLTSDQAQARQLASEISKKKKNYHHDGKAQMTVSRYKKFTRYLKANPKKSMMFGAGAVLGLAGSVLLLSNPFGWAALAATASFGLAAQVSVGVGVTVSSGLLGVASTEAKRIGRGKRKAGRKLSKVVSIFKQSSFSAYTRLSDNDSSSNYVVTTQPRKSLGLDDSSLLNEIRQINKSFNNKDIAKAVPLNRFMLLLTDLLSDTYSDSERIALLFYKETNGKMLIEEIASLQQKFMKLDNFNTILSSASKSGVNETVHAGLAAESTVINTFVDNLSKLQAEIKKSHRETAIASFRQITAVKGAKSMFEALFNFHKDTMPGNATHTTALQAASSVFMQIKPAIQKAGTLAHKLYSFNPSVFDASETAAVSSVSLSSKTTKKQVKTLWDMVVFENSSLDKMKKSYEKLVSSVLKKPECLSANAGLNEYKDSQFTVLDVLVRAERRLFEFDATQKGGVSSAFSIKKQCYVDILCQQFNLNHTFAASYNTAKTTAKNLESQILLDLNDKGFKEVITSGQTIEFYGMQFTPLQMIHYVKAVVDKKLQGENGIVCSLLTEKNPVKVSNNPSSIFSAAPSAAPSSSSQEPTKTNGQ